MPMIDGVHVGYYCETGRDRVAKFDKPAVKIMFQVTHFVRFLLERGLRFRNLSFCGLGHASDMIY